MSIKLMTAVWENDQTNGSERLVLMALADMANDAGVCWPSYLTLARKANISRRSAIRYMHSLINKGLVRKEYRTDYSDPNDLKQTSNLYTIVVTPSTLPSDIHDTTPSDNSVTPLVTTVSPKPSLNPKYESSVNGTPERKNIDINDALKIYKKVANITLDVGNLQRAYVLINDCQDNYKFETTKELVDHLIPYFEWWKSQKTKDTKNPYNSGNPEWIAKAAVGDKILRRNKRQKVGPGGWYG